MKNKKHQYLALIILLILLVLRILYSRNPAMIITDFILIILLFSDWTNENPKKFKRFFYFFSIAILINEGIIQNAGGDNWPSVGIELFAKVILLFFINMHIKYIGGKK